MVIWCSIVPVLYLAINLYIYVIIASAIFSWLYAFNIVNTSNQFVAMIAHFLYALTEPAFRPIRRFMPNLGGIDLSPIVVILLLIVLQNLLRQGSGCFGY